MLSSPQLHTLAVLNTFVQEMVTVHSFCRVLLLFGVFLVT